MHVAGVFVKKKQQGFQRRQVNWQKTTCTPRKQTASVPPSRHFPRASSGQARAVARRNRRERERTWWLTGCRDSIEPRTAGRQRDPGFVLAGHLGWATRRAHASRSMMASRGRSTADATQQRTSRARQESGGVVAVCNAFVKRRVGRHALEACCYGQKSPQV